jgi:glycosyltransferase involved in cell wall biosynthesis
MSSTKEKPLISVIIEGYNDSRDLGTVEETMAALENQDFPTNRVEILLVGSRAQAEGWNEKFAGHSAFFAVRAIGRDQAHYYQLKNEGAQLASGSILAMLDSDVIPDQNWLSSIYRGIVEDRAEAVAGISLFRHKKGLLSSRNPLLLAAASISWGFVVPQETADEHLLPNAFLSHNLGIRKEVFDRHFYREDLGRTCAGSFLYNNLFESGAAFYFQTDQRVAHNFSFVWWLGRINFRSGYEIYRLRRIDPRYPNKFLTKLGFAEPFFSFFWNVLIDVPRWFRFSRFLGFGPVRRWLYVPLVVGLSCCARSAESLGMLATIFFRKTMRRYAEDS